MALFIVIITFAGMHRFHFHRNYIGLDVTYQGFTKYMNIKKGCPRDNISMNSCQNQDELLDIKLNMLLYTS